jgi:AraC-like DNA-binding protein
VLILDTADLPVDEAFEAYHATLLSEGGSAGVAPEPGLTGPARWRISGWRLGAITLNHSSGPGCRYWQTTRHLRIDSFNMIAAMAPIQGLPSFRWNDFQRDVRPGDLVLSNRSAGFWEYGWTGFGEMLTFMVDVDEVGLPERMVHAAMPRVQQSPVLSLLLNQMQALYNDADRLADESVADAVGDSTVALVRALIASVGAARREQREVAEETRMVRILAYVEAHLNDPDLSAARIAAVHNVSLRSLYRLCKDNEVRLESWIFRRRLEGACKELVDPRSRHRTIEAISRSWGFTHPSHFNRRFREAYGVTPRVWRGMERPERRGLLLPFAQMDSSPEGAVPSAVKVS